MATTWDTYSLIYMGTIIIWLTIVCSSKHTLFPTSNKVANTLFPTSNKIERDEEETIYTQATESLRVVLTNIQHGPEVL
jgi:hypothetical protein